MTCEDDSAVYSTSANGSFGGLRRSDLWVVDVAGTTYVVFSGHDGDVPPQVLGELEAVVESIEFVVPN